MKPTPRARMRPMHKLPAIPSTAESAGFASIPGCAAHPVVAARRVLSCCRLVLAWPLKDAESGVWTSAESRRCGSIPVTVTVSFFVAKRRGW